MRSGLPGCGGVAQSEAERRPTEVPCRCTRIQRQCITTTCAAALTWRRQGQLRSTQGLSTESVVCRLLLLVLVCARLGHRAAKRSAIPDKCSPGGWECGVDLSTATPALCAWSMPRSLYATRRNPSLLNLFEMAILAVVGCPARLLPRYTRTHPERLSNLSLDHPTQCPGP